MTSQAPVILVVDDDVDFLESTRVILRSGGYEVVGCYDPDSAWAALQARHVDLVITDLMMTSLDAGFSLAQKIRHDPRLACVRVIVVTSASSASGFDFHPHSPEDLKQMSADAFFDKPLTRAALLSKIQELLNTAAREKP
jgi:CheY-like chemotaxis protein